MHGKSPRKRNFIRSGADNVSASYLIDDSGGAEKSCVYPPHIVIV